MRIALALLCIAFVIGCKDAELPNSKIIGLYEVEGFNNGRSLELRSDSQFVFKSYFGSCFGYRTEHYSAGRYAFNGTNLVLSPQYFISTDFSRKGRETYDSAAYYDSDSTHLKTKFRLITWDSARYLLCDDYRDDWGNMHDNDFDQFVEHYNAGYAAPIFMHYLTSKPRGHVPVSRFDVSQLPAEYQSFILSKPLEAEVVSVMKTEQKYFYGQQGSVNLYKLNKGQNQGVFKRMVFYGDGGCTTIRVTEVEGDVSYGVTHLCFDLHNSAAPGTKLSTYNGKLSGKSWKEPKRLQMRLRKKPTISIASRISLTKVMSSNTFLFGVTRARE
jgi:hypothetical protein